MAKTVAAGRHCIAGEAVEVALSKPLQFYANKLMFSNVPRGVSHDVLAKRLQKITGQEADEILYGDEATVIIVTFDEKPGRLVSQLVGALSPVNHRGLHQG